MKRDQLRLQHASIARTLQKGYLG